MVIQEKKGNLSSREKDDKTVDWLTLEWYETSKRILHKRTQGGKEITMKFMKENQQLTQGDILFEDAGTVVAIDIMPCEAIIIKPVSMLEMANICYEIGNKHLPLFYDNDQLLVAYELPLFSLLKNAGYAVETGSRKLLQPLKTTVSPHGSSSLFSKIMNLKNGEK